LGSHLDEPNPATDRIFEMVFVENIFAILVANLI
jgi:hypothetical protein